MNALTPSPIIDHPDADMAARWIARAVDEEMTDRPPMESRCGQTGWRQEHIEFRSENFRLTEAVESVLAAIRAEAEKIERPRFAVWRIRPECQKVFSNGAYIWKVYARLCFAHDPLGG